MRWITAIAIAGWCSLSSSAVALAHTEADLVAVPAGTESTITLKPTHGCGESPTVAVRVRAPVEGALPESVEGWAATSTPDGAGNTVLEWTGGRLPADQDGAFPVVFSAPDAPGELLTFPAIQVCENGEELAWISGDPQDEFPAPRVLVLPVGYEPAATIDDVPLDAPGRQQLVEIVDVDNPQATTTAAAPSATVPATTTAASTTEPTSTTTTTTTIESTVPAISTATTITDDDGGGGRTPAIVVAVVAALGVGAFGVSRRRRSLSHGPQEEL